MTSITQNYHPSTKHYITTHTERKRMEKKQNVFCLKQIGPGNQNISSLTTGRHEPCYIDMSAGEKCSDEEFDTFANAFWQ